MTDQPTNLDLDDIEARAARLYERTATIDPNAHPDFGQLTDADVPALLDEVRRLRAQVAELEDDASLLSALQAAGVDNWEGYDDALERL